MDITTEQRTALINLVARGVSLEAVSRAVRLPLEQVTAIVERGDVAQEISEATAGAIVTGLTTDNKWDAVEAAALDGIISDLQRSSTVYEPGTLLMLANSANRAKRRHSTDASRDGVLGRGAGNGTQVTINLPTVVIDRLQKQVKQQLEIQLEVDKVGEEAHLRKQLQRDKNRAANLHKKFASGGITTADVERVMDLDLRQLSAVSKARVTDEFMDMVDGTGTMVGGDEVGALDEMDIAVMAGYEASDDDE